MNVDYIEHYKAINNIENLEASYQGAKSYYEAELTQIFPHVNKNLPVLEIGSGCGFLTKYMTENGFTNITCVDFSKGLLDVIASWVKPCPKLINDDANHFMLSQNNKYGLIILYDLFEHISKENVVQFTQNVYNSLDDDGMLIIRTPNMANFLGSYSRYIDKTHFAGYTQFSIIQVLTDAGFDQNSINIWESKWKGEMYNKKRLNDILHLYLYDLQDRASPLTFEKNLLVSATKKTKNIKSDIEKIDIKKIKNNKLLKFLLLTFLK